MSSERPSELDLAAQFFVREETNARMVVAIIGEGCAAHRALSELQQRRQAGQDAVIWSDSGRWFVGPRPDMPPAAAADHQRERRSETP